LNKELARCFVIPDQVIIAAVDPISFRTQREKRKAPGFVSAADQWRI